MTEAESVAAPPTRPAALAGRVALVTGAARGIGAACAVALAEGGADLVLVDLLDCGETAAAVAARGRAAMGLTADVGDRGEVFAAFDAARRRLGRIDILVAAAGIMPAGPVVADAEQWDRVIRVNLTGAQNCVAAAWGIMVAQRGGKIVLVSSIAAHVGGRIAGTEYIAAKAGLLGITRHVARNGGPHGIFCNAVTPGVIETEMNRAIAKPDPATIPLGRLGTPEDVALPVRFLCSDESNYVTGAVLPINGGQLFSA